MKKFITRILTLMLICCILTTALCTPAFAANGNIYFNDPSVVVGNNVYVSMSVGDSVAMYDIYLSYDSSLLEYAGASGGTGLSVSGGGGSIRLNDYNPTGAGTFNCTLTFKTLATGTAKITVSSYDIVDDNGDPVAGHIGSSAVTITNPPTASSDAKLSALSISPGTLSPAFDPSTTNYTATVSSGTTKLTVSATKNHSAASVSVSDTSLSVGKNNVYVTVTAEDGTQKTYTIVVTRPAATVAPETGSNPGGTPETDTPAPPEVTHVTLATGQILEVSETIDEEKIPKGFSLTETTIETFTVDAITYGENADVAVWLKGDDSAPEGFYFIGKDGVGYPMVTFTQPETGIIMIDLSRASAPEGYKAGKFTIGETEYDAFIPDNGKEPDHCLIFGINGEGESILYSYDPIEGTYQKYGVSTKVEIKEVEVEVEVPVEPEVPEEPETPAEPEKPAEPTVPNDLLSLLKDKRILYIAVGVAAVIVVLIILCIVLGVMYSRKSKACSLMAAKRTAAVTSTEE